MCFTKDVRNKNVKKTGGKLQEKIEKAKTKTKGHLNDFKQRKTPNDLTEEATQKLVCVDPIIDLLTTH